MEKAFAALFGIPLSNKFWHRGCDPIFPLFAPAGMRGHLSAPPQRRNGMKFWVTSSSVKGSPAAPRLGGPLGEKTSEEPVSKGNSASPGDGSICVPNSDALIVNIELGLCLAHNLALLAVPKATAGVSQRERKPCTP